MLQKARPGGSGLQANIRIFECKRICPRLDEFSRGAGTMTSFRDARSRWRGAAQGEPMSAFGIRAGAANRLEAQSIAQRPA
jgi:hypothetical protein